MTNCLQDHGLWMNASRGSGFVKQHNLFT